MSKRVLEEDLKLLDYLRDHDIKDASMKFKRTENSIRGWLYRIRKRVTLVRFYHNNILTMQRQSPRIRKLTSEGRIPPEETEDEQEDPLKFR